MLNAWSSNLNNWAGGQSGAINSSAQVATQVVGQKETAVALAISESLQTSVTGNKSALGSIASSIAGSTGIAVAIQRLGSISSSHTATTLISTGDALLELTGYAVSSNVPTSLVTGFKTALGVAATTQNTISAVFGKKQVHASLNIECGAATTLLAMADRAGWITSVGIARTFITGHNPEANVAKKRYPISARRNNKLTYKVVI